MTSASPARRPALNRSTSSRPRSQQGLTGGGQTVDAFDVFNASDPANTGNFITQYTLPAQPFDVAIGDGIGFVADGTGGLQVVDYLPFDTKGVAPTIAVTQGPADVDAGTAGVQVTEGSTVALQASISDDVQVRDVAVLVNGVAVADSVAYPWNCYDCRCRSISRTAPTR